MKKFFTLLLSFFILINITSISFATEINDLDNSAKEILLNIKYTRNILFNLLGVELTTETFAEEEEQIEYDGVVYLTFDDGPIAKFTEPILDTLKANGVKATFFELGLYVNENPNLAKRVHDEGHTIGSHSYSHKKEIYSSFEKFKKEILDTETAIENATGEKPKFFRPPYGYKLPQNYKDFLAERGYEIILWNCESNDSRSGKLTPEYCLQTVKDTSKNKKEVTVIMHDTYNKQHTVDALQSIIDYFKELNYEFKQYGE